MKATVGEKVFVDSFSGGILKGVALTVYATGGRYDVKVRITSKYRRGEVTTMNGMWVIPRRCFRRIRGKPFSYYSLPYIWVEQEEEKCQSS